ncbi:hypothetical protein LTR95_010117 [Oleoguttula sp. CCFEE 5521]
MSDPTRTLSKAIPASHSRLSAQDLKDLQGCEKASGIIKRVNNPEPYTQTIPQLAANAYHHHSQLSATQYRRETGLQRDDPEWTQYMSYVHLPAEGIIQQHAMSVLEKPAEQKSGSAKGTPNLGPKKVMSFNDYKKKAAGGSAAEKVNGNGAGKLSEKAVEKQTAMKGPAERVREETRDMLKAAEQMESDAEKPSVNTSKASKSASQHQPAETKRKRSEERHDELAQNAKADDLDPPPKKARLSTPLLPDTSTTAAATSKDATTQPQVTAVPTTHLRTKLTNKIDAPVQPTTVEEAALPLKLSPIKERHRKTPLSTPMRGSQELPRKLSPVHHQRRKSSSPSPPHDASQLPRKLSPLRAEHTPPGTFDRLSPTLPGNILTALEQKEQTRNDAATKDRSAPNSANKKDVMLTPNAAVNGAKHRSPAPRNGFRANSHSPAAAEHVVQPSTQTSRPERQKTLIEDDNDEADQSLIVKLKIKKSMRPDVKRLLAFPGGTAVNRTPLASSVKPQDLQSSDSIEPHATDKPAAGRDAARRSGKGVAQKIIPTAKKVGTAEKRPREDSEVADSPAKKHKADEGSSGFQSKPENGPAVLSSPVKKRVPEPLQLKGRSTTPAQPDLRTPTTSSASKSQLATPVATNNRLAAVAMAREPSRESNYGTPTAPAPDTPPTTTQPRSQLTSSGPTSTVTDKIGTQVTWNAQTAHFTSLGTSFKRAAQASHASQPAQAHTAALQALESFMAFILSFHCSDQSAQSAEPPSRPALQPWRSLVPYYGFVQKHCAPFALLAGIAAHLTVVTTSHILTLATQMPDRAPSHNSLLEIIGVQRKAAMEAEKHLNIHTLISMFPESWRSACASAGAADLSAPANATALLTGAFDLPLGCHTTPLMGVRASKALLKEWSVKQGGGYEFKLAAN